MEEAMKMLVVIPKVPVKFTPSIYKIFESEQIAYDGRRAGFRVKKEYANKSERTGIIITSRRFVKNEFGIKISRIII